MWFYRLCILAATFFCVLLVVAPAAQAQTVVVPEIQFWHNGPQGGSNAIQYDLFVAAPFGKSSWSFNGWALHDTTGWGEAYGGVAKNITPWLNASFQVGLQNVGPGRKPWQLASTVWVGNNIHSALLIVEKGDPSYWYKFTWLAKARATEHISAGFLAQRNVGFGPLFQINVGKMHIWTAPIAFGYGGARNMSGIKFDF